MRENETVWILERDEDGLPVHVIGCVLAAIGKDAVFCSANPVGFDGCIAEYLIDETWRCGDVEMLVFPRKDAFSTREEAHAAKNKEG